MTPDEEIDVLREEIDRLRERELESLRRQLGEAEIALIDTRAQVEHYRAEAYRNADVGRHIASEAERTIKRLRDQLTQFKVDQTRVQRLGPVAKAAGTG